MKDKVEISLNWIGGCNVNNIQEFMELHGMKGGLYFWIFKGNPERIAYIGETKNFHSRFEAHFSNSLHGLYSAFDCDTSKDLNDEYIKASKNIFENFYTPKKTSFSNLNEQAEEIIRGVKTNLSFLNNLRFVFAEIEAKDAGLRKQVETIFMLKTRQKYKAFKCSDWRDNASFWGVKSVNLKENVKYVIHSKGELDKLLQKEVGLSELLIYEN